MPDTASEGPPKSTNAPDRSIPKDTGLAQAVLDYVKDARKRYGTDETAYPSRGVRTANEQIVELVFSELRDLENPKKLEEIRDPKMQGNYADALSLLGWESVRKDRVSEHMAPDLIEETARVGGQSEKLFMQACEKLFPDLKTQVGARDLEDNFQAVGDLLTGDEVSDVGATAKSDANEINQIDADKARTAVEYSIGQLGNRMRDAMSQDQDTFAKLKAVPTQQRETMINAAKAMYTLRLSTPKTAIMSEAEMVLAKARTARTTVR